MSASAALQQSITFSFLSYMGFEPNCRFGARSAMPNDAYLVFGSLSLGGGESCRGAEAGRT
jgi:hypothetical protein